MDGLALWLWHHLALPVIGFGIELVPWPVWLVIGGLGLGWAWKTFGWQGLVGAGLALLTFGAYRQGWRDAVSKARGMGTLEPERPGNFFDTLVRNSRPAPIKKPKRPNGKRVYNPDTNTWE